MSRITGSPGFQGAADWAVSRLEEYGLEDARQEKWGPFGQGWSRSYYSAHLLAPQVDEIRFNLAIQLLNARRFAEAAGVLERLPVGPVWIDDPRFVLPEKEKVYGSIEGLMHHFKIIMEGIKVPPGETYAAVEGGVGARALVVERQRRATDNRRAGRFGQRARRRAVVAVGVGADDRGDALAFGGGEDRLDMVGQIGPRIDHRHLAGADDIGLRARIGEGRGIGGEQPTHLRVNPLDRFRARFRPSDTGPRCEVHGPIRLEVRHFVLHIRD